jgi:hypothetical protein
MNTEEIRKHLKDEGKVRSPETRETLALRLLADGYYLVPLVFTWSEVEAQ